MEEKFDWMTFGDDAGPGMRSAPHAGSGGGAHGDGDDEDVPIFLREEAGAGRAGGRGLHHDSGTTPAFLAGYPTPDSAVSAPGGVGHAATAAASPATAWDGAQRQRGTADIAAAAGAAAGAFYADQPSAAVLAFTGDSGRAWTGLQRVRILGKGNYGCATLYAMGGAGGGDHVRDIDVDPRHAVVVKDINMQTMLNPTEEVAAVQSELRVLRTVLGHPNLVQYVDGLFDSRPASYPLSFIMMEYCAGGDLAAVMEGRGSGGSAATASPLSAAASGAGTASPASQTSAVASPRPLSDPLAEPIVAALFIQTAVALQALHTEYGILHRDVKPHNIFLLEDGLTVRLGDFGIATQLGRVGDTAKEACGSPYYMAPELFEERAYGAAADVWSLGVVFYQLIARVLPFNAASAADLRTLVCRGRFTPLQELGATASPSAAGYSRELKELVSSLLTVDAAARPTLRRVLRHKYVKEYLKYVPATVLTAQRPDTMAGRPSSACPGGAAAGSGVYASVFGADLVAEAVAQAVYGGVSPIVNRIIA